MPQHTNPQNTIFGGVVMSWVDIAASMSASKHCNRAVVTVHVDEFSFISPIKVGEHVLIQAAVNYVGKTSMVIGVKVQSENPYTNEMKTTTRAYLTFVALDEKGNPCNVPKLILENEEQKRWHENARLRMESNRELRKNLEKSKGRS
ncbi:MAG: acyl-CoA thioesterase [Halobacteriovoraceae bacterium]|nr:acyl-CoA thioesterase [Halobacteriovoraceae bacterium]